MKTRLSFVLLVVFFAAACTKEPEPTIVLDEAEFTDISYGNDARHQLDVYLPKGRNRETPVVILIHGGAWNSGSRRDMAFVQEALNILPLNKFAFVNIDYRYANESTHVDDMLADIGRALKTVRSSSATWGIRDRDFTLLGVSSGAHLAMLYAYGLQQANEVKSVISVAGPTDLRTLTQNPLENLAIANHLLGIEQPDFADPAYRKSSPLHQVARAVPTLMVHGNADAIVPYEQSLALKAALDERGVPHKLVTVVGVGHDLQGVDGPAIINVFGEIRTWIRTYGN